MQAIYIAHPLGQGTERENNRKNAVLWGSMLAQMFNICPMSQWTSLAEIWAESMRELGLAIDFEQIRRCDELWLVGGRISPGMGEEKAFALSLGKPVLDLTHLGYHFPAAGTLDHAALIRLVSQPVRE